MAAHGFLGGKKKKHWKIEPMNGNIPGLFMQISYLDYYRNQNMDLNMHMNCACVIKNLVRKTTHGKEQELVGSKKA